MSSSPAKSLSLRWLRVVFPVLRSKIADKKVVELLAAEKRQRLPKSEHILLSSMLPRSPTEQHYMTVHIDRDEDHEQRAFKVEVVLAQQPPGDPPSEVTTNRKAGRDLEWAWTILASLAPERTAITAVFNAPSDALVRAKIDTPTIAAKTNTMAMALRGAEFHAPDGTTDGAVRFGWHYLTDDRLRVELVYYASIKEVIDPWQQVAQRAKTLVSEWL